MATNEENTNPETVETLDEAALNEGMAEKSKEFVQTGSDVYNPA